MKKKWIVAIGKRILAVLVIVLLVDLFGCVSLLLYYPVEDFIETPQDMGMKYEDIELASTEGKKIHGWWIPHENPQATILFCHGNAGNVGDRVEFANLFHSLSLSVLMFDYQGFGKSQGSPSEQGTYDDAMAAWNFLVKEKGIRPGEIAIYGKSLGGAIAIQLATKVESGALFVDSSFTNTLDVAKVHYGWAPKTLLRKHMYDSISRISTVRTPVCFFHSPQDGVVPFNQGQALYSAASPPKEFVKVSGSHNGNLIQSKAAYAKAIKDFIDKHMGARWALGE